MGLLSQGVLEAGIWESQLYNGKWTGIWVGLDGVRHVIWSSHTRARDLAFKACDNEAVEVVTDPAVASPLDIEVWDTCWECTAWINAEDRASAIVRAG